MASKLTADIAADEAAPIDPNMVAMERDRLAPMTFQLSGNSGMALRIRLKVRRSMQLHAMQRAADIWPNMASMSGSRRAFVLHKTCVPGLTDIDTELRPQGVHVGIQPEADEELGQWAGGTPLVRAEYAWLSAAKQGAHSYFLRCFRGAGGVSGSVVDADAVAVDMLLAACIES